MNINAFQNKLQLTKTYLISNATVKKAKPEYREHNDEMHWTITGRTMIQELNESHDNLLEAAYNFTPFTELHAQVNKLTADICNV